MLKKWIDRFTSATEGDPQAYWVYAQCEECDEKLRARIDLNNDLSVQYGASEQDETFFCRKVLIGSQRCFRPIEVELTFDKQRRLIDRQIHGGHFITQEAYEAG